MHGCERKDTSSGMTWQERINGLSIFKQYASHIQSFQLFIHRFPGHTAFFALEQITALRVELYIEFRGFPFYIVVACGYLLRHDFTHIQFSRVRTVIDGNDPGKQIVIITIVLSHSLWIDGIEDVVFVVLLEQIGFHLLQLLFEQTVSFLWYRNL